MHLKQLSDLMLSGEYLEWVADGDAATELSEGAVVEAKSVPDIGDCASLAALFHHSSCDLHSLDISVHHQWQEDGHA